ncbi:hypothetical protein Pelo_13448 [Pelomyxa schiedti]|nr:hypothetical protein Pelo_13448 [Pelomyxa schiedti]
MTAFRDGFPENTTTVRLSLCPQQSHHCALHDAHPRRTPTTRQRAQTLGAQQPQQQQPHRAKYTRNGGQCATHIWGQTKKELHVCVFVPSGTRARDLVVRLTPYNRNTPAHLTVRPAARPAPPSSSSVPVSASGCYVDGDLTHPVNENPEDLESCWGLEDWDATRRVVHIEVKKYTMENVAMHWWTRVFFTDPPVGIDALVDCDTTPEIAAKNKEFSCSWEDSHPVAAKFLQKS